MSASNFPCPPSWVPSCAVLPTACAPSCCLMSNSCNGWSAAALWQPFAQLVASMQRRVGRMPGVCDAGQRRAGCTADRRQPPERLAINTRSKYAHP
jgi:hypothetical protein